MSRLTQKQTYFSGRLVLESLGARTHEDGRFYGGDHRGDVAMVVSNRGMEHVEVAEFREQGVKRAYHYHETFVKTLYVVEGQLLVVAKDVNDSAESVELQLSPGDVLTIQPYIAQAYLALQRSWVLSMGVGGDPFQRRHPYPDLSFSVEG